MMPTRRQFGAAATGVTGVIAGCLTGEPGTGFGRNTTENEVANDNAEGEATGDQLGSAIRQLAETLDERGLPTQSTTTTDNAFRLRVQTTGDHDDDVEIAASAFATLLNSRPTVTRDLRVRVEDRGLSEGRFRIRVAWARQLLNDELSDSEYLSLIANTWRE